MFKSDILDNHLKQSSTIQIESAVYVEWNLNQMDNIERLGNYRYRPQSNSKYTLLPYNYDQSDFGNYYTGATDSDIAVDVGFDDENIPTIVLNNKEKMKNLYSLQDCVKPYRPRSGINKLLYLKKINNPSGANQYIDDANSDSARRPRYYMSSKYDNFKYWTSYRTEWGIPTLTENSVSSDNTVLRQVERGISVNHNGINYIEDAVPFVVYKNQVPTNKIVVKMQTNVGEVDTGNARYGDTEIPDPLYGFENSTTPVRWKIEGLKNNSWVTLFSFNEFSLDENGDPLIKSDGYIEISYGLNIPDQYKNIFVFAETITSSTLLPQVAPDGYSYLVKESEQDIGTMYIYYNDDWVSFIPTYGWSVGNQDISNTSKIVKKLSNPDYFTSGSEIKFREFEFIRGIRIVVETMNKSDCTFDLIEFSPRLIADISSFVNSFSVNKTMSDLGNGSIPVGSLNVGTGSIEIFDTEFCFNTNNVFNHNTNTGSIIAEYINIPAKFLFYDITRNINQYDYFIPIKTMYGTEGFPQVTDYAPLISINLRDFFFYLESQPAPELLMTDVSLSYAVMLLLDNIGFDNVVFKRIDKNKELVIPFFFIPPDKNCAEILQELAVASQTAMFFDEYNNFIVMSKEYLLPDNDEQRQTDSFLLGQEDGNNFPNIINLASSDKRVYNSGKIDYTTRYIQRSIASTDMASKLDRYQEYTYKPVLLWEVQGKDSTVTINEMASQNSGYTLSAAPLNTSLSNEIPSVKNNTIYNNIIDLGENIRQIGSYNGYLYANGEVIKYDAIEYAVTSKNATENIVWIGSSQEYSYYMSKLPFNGKMYRTGNLRIYAKPEYESVNGEIRMKDTSDTLPMIEHGRGQFNTPIVSHSAGLIEDDYWTNSDNTYGVLQQASDFLFNINEYINYPDNINSGSGTQQLSSAGKIQENFPSTGQFFDADALAKTSAKGGVVKNFMSDTLKTENEINYSKTTDPGTIQSSALIFTGPTIPSNIKSSNFVSMIHKNLNTTEDSSVPREIKQVIANGLIIRYKPGYSTTVDNLPRGSSYVSIIDKNRLSLSDSLGNDMYKINISEPLVSLETSKQICEQMKLDEGVLFVESDVFLVIASKYNVDNLNSIIEEQIKEANYIDRDSQSRFIDYPSKITNISKYTHFGTRMRIIGKIESGTSKNQTPLGNFEIFQTSNSPDQEVKVYGGSGGIAFNIDPATGIGYFFEIVALTVNNIGDYGSSNAPSTSSFKILSSPAVSCTNNEVTAYTENPINFQVGQNVRIIGLVDNNSPNTAITPLNGEYIITAINNDKKSFKYKIDASPALTTTSKTGGDVFAVIPTNNNFANIHFYKTIPYNKEAEIVSWQRTNNVLTINTKDNHKFMVGDTVYIYADPQSINADTKFVIKSVQDKSFTVDSSATNTALIILTDQLKAIITAATNASDPGRTNFLFKTFLVDSQSIPYKLWSGLSQINVDSGQFVGQGKAFADKGGTTCYDLAAEYINVGSSRRFFLYINNKQIATVVDENPLPEKNSLSVFVRGSSQCAFENVYALGGSYSENTNFKVQGGIAQIFGDEEINANEALRKYALSGIIQKTYLNTISSQNRPEYSLFFEEFGTIMRECAYFNIKYDRAFPVLYAKLAKTINQTKGYSVSGFYAGSYGAEFLIFNCSDFNINLDDTSGNYLRIHGIAFTQNTTYSISMDDYFKNKSQFINNTVNKGNLITDPNTILQEYNRIKNTRDKYGINEFSIQSTYIQTHDTANEVFDWVISKVSLPRKLVGINTFATSNLQLGDIVTINYKSKEGVNIVSEEDTRFVIYNMDYKRDINGLATTIYLAEV